MTNKEFRAKIYQWVHDCYKINVTSTPETDNRKKLKKILDEFNPTQELSQPIKEKKVIKIIEKKSEWKSYPDTKF